MDIDNKCWGHNCDKYDDALKLWELIKGLAQAYNKDRIVLTFKHLLFRLDIDETTPLHWTICKPNLDIIAMFLDFTVDRFFNFCGYNSPQGTREHGTNKTGSEIAVNMQNDMLTTQLKIQLRTKYINRLIQIIGKVMGYDKIDCYIEIHGVSTTEQATFRDGIILRYQSGLISREKAIAKLDRISMEEAEEEAEKIEKEEKVKQEQEMKTMQQKTSSSQPLKGGKK